MRFQEGRAWHSQCPVERCSKPVIEAHVNGFILRLDTKAIPLKDALIYQKYAEIVINVWIGSTQLYATPWHRSYKTVDKGHLYIAHVHKPRTCPKGNK